MPTQELLYQIALTQVPNIGDVLAKELLQSFENATAIFKAPLRHLEKIEGIGTVRGRSIKNFHDFKRIEKEIRFLEKYRIIPLFYTSEKYPARLRNCYDSPVILYYKGSADLNQARIIGLIGTRGNTPYGREVTEQLVAALVPQQVLIVSGLAYGIDILSHKAALKNKLPTVGVLAHGLDRIYPAAHKSIATQMLENGGLLTDFMSATNPDKQNFPRRNRIVAGMTDATIVIESGIKGGSLITAAIANSYNRDVFAIPGRVNDPRSAGCNYLIKSNKAAMITGAADMVEMMGWEPKEMTVPLQKELFIPLPEEEKALLALFREKEVLHIDEIRLQSKLSASQVAAAVLNLELQSLLRSLPGKMYRAI